MSIRTLLVGFAIALAALLAAQLLLAREELKTQALLEASEERRFRSMRLADLLRQTSDDLTRMARTFVVTGDPRFANYFERILAIRNGEAPRPERYDEVYWDLLVPDDRPPTADGPPVALEMLFRRAGFTDAEFAQLKLAQDNSDALVALETRAMNATRGLFPDKRGRFTVEGEPAPELARALMHGEEYHAAKAQIMAPINTFLGMLDARTAAERDAIAGRRRGLAHVGVGLTALTLIITLTLGVAVARRVSGRLALLAEGLQRVEKGDLDARVELAGGDEIATIGARFNVMAASLSRQHEQLERQSRELNQKAHYDDLTGLPNRTLFRREFDRVVAGARRDGDPVALLFVDLDGFKRVNDSLGHGAGDQLLREVSARLQACVRESDMLAATATAATAIDGGGSELLEVGRFGGDEFIVCLSSLASAGDAGTVAARICAALSQPIEVATTSVVTTPSIGIAVHPDDGDDYETLLKRADTAMYAAKDKGKNQYAFFSTDIGELASDRLLLEGRLRLAIERNTLELHFQPLVQAGTGIACAAEALLRWTDAELGEVRPDRLFAVAEESSLVEDLDRWVVRRACDAWCGWRDIGLGSITICVNVSPRTFLGEGFVEFVREAVAASGIPRGALELEITERGLVTDTPRMREALAALRAGGVSTAIDDFGTGFSSLAYLKQFDVDVLKIDRSFVTAIDADERTAGIVGAIVSMARALGFATVAEGVESEAEQGVLRRLGVDVLQGWLYSRALPEAEARQWLLRDVEPAPEEAPRRTGS